MADLKNDWIDFGKLEKELDKAVEKDARYWRENDAKFRAVDQRVETYEQFRDIVKAAHIKPLEKKDKIGEGKRNQPWNPYTSNTSGAETPAKSDEFSRKDSSSIPRTSHEFTRDWQSRCKTPNEKYHLLTSLGGEQLGHIFRAEIGSGLLGDFVTVMNERFQGSDLHCIVGILGSLAGTNRFGLSVDFLSKAEKRECAELFQRLQEASTNVSSDFRAEDVPSEATVSAEHQPCPTVNERTDTVQEKLASLREVYKI